jgi:WD40 repeat protein
MIWFARGLVVAPPDASDLQRAIRINLDAWGRVVPSCRGNLGAGQRVLTMAAGPDGRTLLTGNYDHTARLWDMSQMAPVGRPMQHESTVVASAFRGDGKVLATGTYDGTARLWGASSGRPISEPLRARHAHRDYQVSIRRVVFSPDNMTLVTVSSEQRAEFWDADSGRPTREPLEGIGGIGLVYSPDGRTILTGGGDSTGGGSEMARLWNASTGRPVGEPMKHAKKISRIAFRPDGQAVATASDDGTAQLWDASTGRAVGEPMRHGGNVEALAFSPDGKLMVTGCSNDGTARLWNASTGRPVGEPMRHGSPIFHASFLPDGLTLLTGSGDIVLMEATRTGGTVRFWDVRTQQPMGEPFNRRRPLDDIVLSPDGRYVATGSYGDGSWVWELDPAVVSRRALNPQDRTTAAEFSPERGLVAIVSEGNTVRVYDTASGEAFGAPMQHPGEVRSAKFSPDGRILATIGRERVHRLQASREATDEGRWLAYLWDPTTAHLIAILGEQLFAEEVHLFAFSPDVRVIAKSDQFGKVHVWDVASMRPVREPLNTEDSGQFEPPPSDGKTLPRHKDVNDIAFSGDGRTMAIARWTSVLLWDTVTWRKLEPPLRHREEVHTVAFSPDGRSIATGCEDGAVRLWSRTRAGEPVSRLEHADRVKRVVFSPDGKFLATMCDDGTTRLWDTTSGQPLGEPLRFTDSVAALSFLRDSSIVMTSIGADLMRKPSSLLLWDSASSRPIGMPFGGRLGLRLLGTAVYADGESILTVEASSGPSEVLVATRRVATPLTGEPRLLFLRTELEAGAELDEWGSVSTLNAARWKALRDELEANVGPPPR